MEIIIIGLQPWKFEIGSNAKDIALEFSKKHKVLYVDPPVNFKEFIRSISIRKIKKLILSFSKHSSNTTLIERQLWNMTPNIIIASINWISSPWLHDLLNRFNSRMFLSAINNQAKQLQFDKIVLFNDSLYTLGAYAPEVLNSDLNLYYTRDNLVSQPYFGRHGKRLEPLTAAKYDAVLGNSDYLTNKLAKYNKNSFMIGQGCDLEKYEIRNDVHKPEDLLLITGPIIGYIGSITAMRLDLDILVSIAKNLNKCSLVLIGPMDETFSSSDLKNYPNVHCLGLKPESQLPKYLQFFDVCINPQILNEMTIGNYPRKIDEYLAMGKPVVAIETIAMKYFLPHVYLATDVNSFIKNIESALEEDNSIKRAERIDCAHRHSWSNCTTKIYDIIYNLSDQSESRDPEAVEIRSYE